MASWRNRNRRMDSEGVEDLGLGITSRPPQVSMPIECLCGRVRGVINGPIPQHQICHCRSCKKVTGGTHGDFLIVKDRHLTFTRGTPIMYSYRVSSPFDLVKSVFRCGECSTPIYTRQGDLPSDRTFVFVGCLVNSEWLDQNKPDDEINVDEKCAWLPRLLRTRTPSPESDMELVPAEPDIDMVGHFRLSGTEEEKSDSDEYF
ncbi:Mss4-like protein [Hypoxylon sp. FL1857]|nr:Mss4-like protein [Hypoxylon sp. FL1857]